MKRNQMAWWLWAVGIVLITLNWAGVVNSTVGWFGFGLGMAGSCIGWGLRPPPGNSPPAAPKTDNKD